MATTGKPPPHYVARPVQNRSTQPNAPPRGQWGDDGYDAYGEGHHRGSSSTGGGRGYAWQSDGSVERPFLGPAGGFVEGLLARIIVREEVFVVIEVVGAGVVGDFAAHNHLGSLFILMLRLRLSFPQSYLHRRWRW